jgi:hypothetical protein
MYLLLQKLLLFIYLIIIIIITIVIIIIIIITCGGSHYTSCGSSFALSCLKHSLKCHNVLCDKHLRVFHTSVKLAIVVIVVYSVCLLIMPLQTVTDCATVRTVTL